MKSKILKAIKVLGVIVGCLILFGVISTILVEYTAETYPEQVYKEVNIPEGKLIFTHYKQYVPYGVKGYVYLEKEGKKTKIDSFFVDFLEDINTDKFYTNNEVGNNNAE